MDISIDKVSKNIAENVAQLRKKRLLSQAALANIASTTRASVSLLESGSANPTLEILFKIAMALKVSIDELISTPHAECFHIKAKDVPLDRRSKSHLEKIIAR